MNDRDYRDLLIALAMPVLLKDDLSRSPDQQLGYTWIAEQAQKVADAIVKKRNKK